MITSLLLKLGMLSLAIGIVIWARWTPHAPVPGIPPTTAQIVSPATEANEPDAGSFRRSLESSDSGLVAQPKPSTMPTPSRLDLNRASAGELESLPGIGTVLAQRVIAYRESVGRFQKIENLREVKGIGAKKYDRLKSLVTVSPGDTQPETERRES
ncbi:MAG: hypothetical protein A4E19_02910 [Nitrospira sp. SG-bin1]|nr:MAG: hypothetical protein A4E19_02910 [Nitrospira sp. SG-bin1]